MIGKEMANADDRSLQRRTGERNPSARQLGNNRPSSRPGVIPAGHRTNLDTAATGLDFCRSQDIIELDAPAATLGSDFAFAFVHLDPAAPRFQDHDFPSSDIEIAPAGLGRDLPASGIDMSGPPAGLGLYVASHLADLNITAAA